VEHRGPQPAPGYDFLEILLDAFEARGLHYSVAAVSINGRFGPTPLVVSEASCPVLEGPQLLLPVDGRVAA
jgi:hypothetical protein